MKPFTIELSVLYSNVELLSKYKKEVPKTWDELLEISKYIMKEELKLNNKTDIISYNGLFCGKYLNKILIIKFI